MIERTRDYDLIRQLATHPAIYPYIADDYHPNPEKWKPIESDFVAYLIARDYQGAFGFAAFVPKNWACYEAHLGFLPRSYGPVALASFREMLAWIFAHTKAARIVGEIDARNRRAMRFVKAAGFTEYGINPKSWLKDGALRDRVCFGISKD